MCQLLRPVSLAGLGLLLGVAPAPSQAPPGSAVLFGRVASTHGPVVSAEVRVGARASSTDADGLYRLSGLPTGEVRVTVSSLGYRTREATVRLAAGDTVRLDLTLEVEAVPVDPVVVTGTLQETRVSDSPVKVEVVSARLLERNRSANLMDQVGQIHGLYEQVDCGVCYTNSIRINGMEGPYTAVLIDGMPIMGALASVYGLNGIDPSLIQQLEILKGPQSTLHGTEAMGGVVNVITKDPRFAPRYSVGVSRSDLGETTANVALAPATGNLAGLVSGSLVHRDRFVDENGDGFSDQTLDTRLSLFGRASLYRDGREAFGVVGKVYHEDRFGGVPDWTEADRGSSEVYGESILTDRIELMARARLPGPHLRAEASWSGHRQDSWYGDARYRADQQIVFGRVLLDPPRRGAQDWLAGATLRWQSYDDDTPATTTAERDWIPGLFVEDAVHLGGQWIALGGLRVDHHGDHGTIAAPRAAVRFQPAAGTTFRLSYGTGFRVVNLFTEDHAALTGSREVVIAEGLRPERSRSVAFNLNQVIEWDGRPMRIDLDLFHTRFSNRIVPDYDIDPDQIVYANLDGEAVSRGVALSLNQNFGDTPFFYTVGITVQDVFRREGGSVRDELFSPSWKGVWTVSYELFDRLGIDWTGTATGPMRLPRYPEPYDRPTRSDAWQVHNLQATLDLGAGRELWASVKNVGDFRQGSPLIAPSDPFGEAFDTNYVWGPVVGRRFVVGLRVAGSR